MPAAVENEVGIVIAGAYNSGLLSQPRPPSDAFYNYEIAPAELVERARAIADVCERHGVTLPEAALAFPLRHPAVVSVVLGMRGRDQARENVRRFGVQVPKRFGPTSRATGCCAPIHWPPRPPPKAGSRDPHPEGRHVRCPLPDVAQCRRLRRHEQGRRLLSRLCRPAHRRSRTSAGTGSPSPSDAATTSASPRPSSAAAADRPRRRRARRRPRRHSTASFSPTPSCAGSAPRRASCTWRWPR